MGSPIPWSPPVLRLCYLVVLNGPSSAYLIWLKRLLVVHFRFQRLRPYPIIAMMDFLTLLEGTATET